MKPAFSQKIPPLAVHGNELSSKQRHRKFTEELKLEALCRARTKARDRHRAERDVHLQRAEKAEAAEELEWLVDDNELWNMIYAEPHPPPVHASGPRSHCPRLR